jgi:hypothetical protein
LLAILVSSGPMMISAGRFPRSRRMVFLFILWLRSSSGSSSSNDRGELGKFFLLPFFLLGTESLCL